MDDFIYSAPSLVNLLNIKKKHICINGQFMPLAYVFDFNAGMYFIV